MKKFNEEMLPILGISWHHFPTFKEAEEFAKWAERVTRNRRHPCECDIEECEDRPASERFEVKVKNW